MSRLRATWRARMGELWRTWRVGRVERRRLRDARQDQLATEELDRGSATRFPPRH